LIVSFGEDLHKWVVSFANEFSPFDSAQRERERERSWEEGQRKKEKLYLVTRNSKKFFIFQESC
jgi:hypothetical protein